MGDSLVADQTTAGAVYRNPAALSRLSGLDLTLNLSILGNGSTWTNTTNLFPSPVSSDLKVATPAAFFVSWSGKISGHGYGVGVGVNIPGGGNVFWPSDWAGRHTIISVDRKLYGMYLTGRLRGHPADPRGWRAHLLLRHREARGGQGAPRWPGRARHAGRLRRRGELGCLARDPAAPRRPVPHRRGLQAAGLHEAEGAGQLRLPARLRRHLPEPGIQPRAPLPEHAQRGRGLASRPRGRHHRRLHLRALQRLRLRHLRRADHRPVDGPAPRALGVAQLRQRQHLPAGRGLAGPPGRSSCAPAASTTSRA